MNILGYVLIRMLLLIVHLLYPSITRQNVKFGVIIPQDKIHHNELKAIVKWYCLSTVFISGALLLGEAALIHFNMISILSALFFFIPLSQAIQLIIYGRAFMKLNKLKKMESWKEEEQHSIFVNLSTKKPVVFSRWFYISPLLFISINVITIAFLYDKIPNEFPVHYTNGVVDRIAEKSFFYVFIMNGIQLLFTAIMIGVMEGIKFSKRQVTLAEANGSPHKDERRKKIVVVYVMTVLFVLFLFLGQLSMLQLSALDIDLMFWVLVVFILAITFIFARPSKQSAQDVVFSTPQSKWVFGLFYVNVKDPAIIVEKLEGTGYTVNLGRVEGWIVFGAPVILSIIIALYSS